MDKQSKQVITTGSGITAKAARASVLMEGQSQPAQAQSGSSSITPAELLTLLQTDLHDLQAQGVTVAITGGAPYGRLYIGLYFPGHDLDTVNGEIRLDGQAVKPMARGGEK